MQRLMPTLISYGYQNVLAVRSKTMHPQRAALSRHIPYLMLFSVNLKGSQFM
jgi:hypothetical protein